MFVANVCIHSMKPKHGTVVWYGYFGQTRITPSKLDLFWPTNASSASGHRASRWAARATPIKKWALVSEAVRGSEPTCSCPGAAAVPVIRAALEAPGVGLIQANGGVIRGAAADVRGRAEPLSRCGHRRSCGAAGHRPPPRARPGADARAPPRTPASAAPDEPLCRCEERQCRVCRDGVAAPHRPGSVDLGRQRQAVEVTRVDGDAGGALGGQGGEEECCSSHGFGPLLCSSPTQDHM
jgi:hypothetical protein